MVKGKYNREYKASRDKQQTKLDPLSTTGVKIIQQTKVDTVLTHAGIYRCAFCLHPDPINAFLISRKKGYDKRLVQCPECKNIMQIETLTKKMTPEEYAQFLFEYSSQGGWQKVRFKVWKERMYAIGWAQPFWEKYRALKGEGKAETYEEHLMRQQEEEARAGGQID
jgi:hypothetical protein